MPQWNPERVDIHGNSVAKDGKYLAKDTYGNEEVCEVKDGYFYDPLNKTWINCRTVLATFTFINEEPMTENLNETVAFTSETVSQPEAQPVTVDVPMHEDVPPKTIRVRIQQHPNPDCRSLHLSQLSPFRGQTIDDMAYRFRSDRKEDKEKNEVLDNPLVKKLFDLPGVESFSSYERYSVSVKKGGVFSWDEVMPAFLSALGELMGGVLVEQGPVVVDKSIKSFCGAYPDENETETDDSI